MHLTAGATAGCPPGVGGPVQSERNRDDRTMGRKTGLLPGGERLLFPKDTEYTKNTECTKYTKNTECTKDTSCFVLQEKSSHRVGEAARGGGSLPLQGEGGRIMAIHQ